MTPEEHRLIDRIADRAVSLYEQLDIKVKAPYIAAEIEFVHREVCPLRLKDFADADESNFAHDIGGIHRHLNMAQKKLEDCFLPRFADTEQMATGHS